MMTHADRGPEFPVLAQRSEFPALRHGGRFIYFDNAAGAQIPQGVLDAVNMHLLEHNVQRGGRYAQSLAVDEMIARARARVAGFLNAWRPEEIAFGMNATSFIRTISLAVGQTLQGREEIIVTDLDHEANIATWCALQSMGARIRWWNARSDGRLHLEDLDHLVSANTRLVACTLASNALGSIVDVSGVSQLAHSVGAEVFIDAVHYGPHGPIDVQVLGCDYLVCSGYKIFAPHMGFLWGRYSALAALPTFREEFIPDAPPGKVEAGTFIYENVAGMAAAVEYLADLGRRLAGAEAVSGNDATRVNCLTAMCAIRAYEQTLSVALLRMLENVGADVYGIADPARVGERVPTVCFNLPGVTPAEVVTAAAAADIGIRDGHMYAPRLMRRLGLSVDSGAVRVSLVHYNTLEEIERFGELLSTIHAV
jgi:cysteine desulfurase family protein (TIGR01976 family)